MVSNTVISKTDEYGEITTAVDAWLEDEAPSSATLCVRARVYGGIEGASYGVAAQIEYEGNGKSELVEAGSGVLNGEDTAVDATYKWTVDKSHEGWTATCKVTSSGVAVSKSGEGEDKDVEYEALPEEALESNEVTCKIAVPITTSYVVTYNVNGGTGTIESQTKWYDEPLSLSTDKPTRTGYTFVGWASSKSATEAEYVAGASYTDNVSAVLYAVWRINTYTVSYNANGGTGAPSSQIKTYGETLVLSDVEPTKEDYLFIGWGTSADDTTVDYEAGGDYTKNAAVTLYAIWVRTYTIHYDANGGENAPEDQIKVTNIALSLTNAIPTKANGVFVGWSTVPDGGAEYYPCYDYVKDVDLTLYAVWESTEHIVKRLFDDEMYDSSARSRLNGVPTSGTGSEYAVEVNGIGSLNVGTVVTIIPHTTSTTVAPTLDVNGLGKKQIRQRLSGLTGNTVQGVDENWIVIGKPLMLIYDGFGWIADVTRPDANSIYGIVPIENGGTGAKTAAEALNNLGITWGTEEAPETGTPGSIYIQIN